MAALFPILLKKQDEHTFHGSLCRCSIVIEMQALYYVLHEDETREVEGFYRSYMKEINSKEKLKNFKQFQ